MIKLSHAVCMYMQLYNVLPHNSYECMIISVGLIPQYLRIHMNIRTLSLITCIFRVAYIYICSKGRAHEKVSASAQSSHHSISHFNKEVRTYAKIYDYNTHGRIRCGDYILGLGNSKI